jgi:hypothetical protein
MTRQTATCARYLTPITSPSSRLLQRKCTCGQHMVAGEMCGDCQKGQLKLQRRAISEVDPAEVLPILHKVISQYPNQNLNPVTCTYIESRFRKDFSEVRSPTDVQEAESIQPDRVLVQKSLLGGHGFENLEIASRERFGIQAKLEIGQPNDKYEQEADRVADQVMRMPEPPTTRKTSNVVEASQLSRMSLAERAVLQHQSTEVEEVEENLEETTLQKKPVASSITPLVQRQVELPEKETFDVPHVVYEVLRSPGQPLKRPIRRFMESRFGQDFSQVRVHTTSKAATSARVLHANSFTVGRNIVFGAGQYSPETSSGRRLLAHELTHVIQQTGKIQPQIRDSQLRQPSMLILQRDEPERDESESSSPDLYDLVAQDLGKKDYADYLATSLKQTTFLGRSVAGIHQQLVDKLKEAEPKIQATLGQSYKITINSTLREKTSSMHAFGMAIDFDVLRNPYILNEAGESKLDEQLISAYDSIAYLILNRSSVIRDLKSGRRAFQEGEPNPVSNAYDQLLEESNAMKQYFEMMDDQVKLEDFLKNNWNRLNVRFWGPMEWPFNEGIPFSERLRRGVVESQAQIKRVYMILGGKDAQKRARPVASGGDRPFAPTSGGGSSGKGDPKTGFLNIPKEVVIALTDSGLAWGAIDLNGVSGDIQHFDTRLSGEGSKVYQLIQKYKRRKQ